MLASQVRGRRHLCFFYFRMYGYDDFVRLITFASFGLKYCD